MSQRIIEVNVNSTNVRYDNFKQQLINILLSFLWRFSPSISKALVKNLFFAPRRYQIDLPEKRYLEESEAFEIVVNDRKVQCWRWGQGPGILLAHGWNGRGIQLHRFIEPLLKKGYSIVTLDAPGHGVSSGKTSSYFEYSDAIRYLLCSRRDLDIKGAVAHSFGAAAVLNAMQKESYPMEAVLVSPPLNLFKIFKNMFWTVGVPDIILEGLIQDYEQKFGYNFKTDEPFRLLPQISSSVLIVHDQDDETIPYADSADAERKFKNVLLHATRGLGHKKILQDTMTIEVIAEYLNGKIPRRAFKQSAMDRSEMNVMLAEYKASDFEKRLHLFLECPELRPEFIQIDLGATG